MTRGLGIAALMLGTLLVASSASAQSEDAERDEAPESEAPVEGSQTEGPGGGSAPSDAPGAAGEQAEVEAEDETSDGARDDHAGDTTDEASDDANDDASDASEDTAAARTSAQPARQPGEPPSIPRRAIPDYDNRPEPGPSAEEIALWIPRVLFFPVHVIFEYVLRQPIGWLMTTAERERWTVLLVDFFTWNDRSAGLVPTAFFDFGFQPSAGLYFWWNDLGAPGNQLRTTVAFGGVDWLRATVSDRVQTSRETELAFTVDAWRRPDYIFSGFGWDSQIDQRSRYFHNYVDGNVAFRFRPWRESEISFAAGVRWNDFASNGYAFASSDPPLASAVSQGWYALPPGFDGYTAYQQRLRVVIDSREERPAPGHGVRVEGFVDQGFDLQEPTDRRWMRYGGLLGGFVDVGSNRVLALWGLVRLADPLGSAPVPFVEQIGLGGEPLLMAGFLRGSLRGRSAAVMTLEYRYPIWVFLDGSLHFSVGNVFDEHFVDFDVERLRMSFGIGFRSIGDRDQSFNVMLAFGSEPFVDGANVDSVRIVIGSQQGF